MDVDILLQVELLWKLENELKMEMNKR